METIGLGEAMNNRILLVGSEPMRLRETTGFFGCTGAKWTLVTASTARQAMHLAGQAPFTAIVSDLYLPDTDGPKFLDQVMDQFPMTQRFLLADLADRQTMLKCVGTAHHFLSKPCDAQKLLAAIDRARKIEIWFANATVKKLVAQMPKVPSPPAIYFQIVKELQSPKSSLENVGAIIAQDLAITAKLLQLVNSAAFGLHREVGNPAQAVLFLGLVMTKSLILLAHTYSHFDRVNAAGFSIDALWRHSLATGQLAERIAREVSAPEIVVEESFTAGLLHDIGRSGVPNAIWERKGTLSVDQWERVRLHVYYTERILTRCECLHPISTIAAAHHERLDGSGYYRGSRGKDLDSRARVLAAADACQAMLQPRPHRPARTLDDAARELRKEVSAGRLDPRAIEAVLAAAGARPRHTMPSRPGNLTDREIEVLRLMAQGRSNREMGTSLGITPKTVGHHVQHIYDKIGVSTRAAAAVFAVEHRLLYS
jgi:HD-GYP domain-containing protein (c-di-GMP phosphodiesterase class II)/ActR/RegA family two-component response regulator